MSPDEFGELYASWMVGPYAGAVELIRTLRQKFHVGCLSNTNEIHIGRLNAQSSFLQEFQAVFLSYETGMLNPRQEAFVGVLKRWDVEAGSVLFLDDSRANIATATAIGMTAVQVSGFDEVKSVCGELLRRRRLQ